jgi:hypothetical protein
MFFRKVVQSKRMPTDLFSNIFLGLWWGFGVALLVQMPVFVLEIIVWLLVRKYVLKTSIPDTPIIIAILGSFVVRFMLYGVVFNAGYRFGIFPVVFAERSPLFLILGYGVPHLMSALFELLVLKKYLKKNIELLFVICLLINAISLLYSYFLYVFVNTWPLWRG